MMSKKAKAPRYVTKFDSAWAFLQALARFLQGRDFPGVGTLPTGKLATFFADHLHGRVGSATYASSGRLASISPKTLGKIRFEDVTQAVVSMYPERSYPAVMIGSSNGAAVHLGAALGIPWLPQTYLITARHSYLDPDDPKLHLEWGEKYGQDLLASNPDLKLHQMQDPSNDRLMSPYLGYFRVKCIRLGENFKKFLLERLPAGGAILVVDCQMNWPVTEIGKRYVFQTGGAGGTAIDEFLHGGPRVEIFLRAQRSTKIRWNTPEATENAPEAEWGFAPELLEDIRAVAKRSGYRIYHLSFNDPEDLSSLVSDFYRLRYRQAGIPDDKLLVESFMLNEPYWALNKGLVPFWTVFNGDPSANNLEAYLNASEPFRQIFLMLFSNGIKSIGLATLERWQALLRRASQDGCFIGMKENMYPSDFAVYMRYDDELKKLPQLDKVPITTPLEQFIQFMEQAKGQYPVEFGLDSGISLSV